MAAELAEDPKNGVVELKPLLLNAREWVMVQFITDGELQAPHITARVAGQSKEIRYISAVPHLWQIGIAVLSLFAASALFTLLVSALNPPVLMRVALLLVPLAVVFSVMLGMM